MTFVIPSILAYWCLLLVGALVSRRDRKDARGEQDLPREKGQGAKGLEQPDIQGR